MSNIVFKTHWFQVIQNSVKQFKEPYYTIKTNDGVVIFALTKNKEVILVKQYRPAYKSYTLEFPSGNKDRNESALKAAKRELYEETGYKSFKIKLLGNNFSIMDNRITAKNNFFLALETEKDDRYTREENIETVLIHLSDFENLIKKGQFRHTAGIATFALAKLNNYL